MKLDWSLLVNPHRKSHDCGLLKAILKDFVGGQFQLLRRKRGDCMHLRGEIQSIEVICDPRTVVLTFNWLCEERLEHDWKLDATLKWFTLERPFKDEIGQLTLTIPFDSFRPHPDEERVKMWGGGFGDICRFYQPFDHTNLVQQGDEFVTRFEKHNLMFLRLVLALLTK
mgnify:CR=1 FL=1